MQVIEHAASYIGGSLWGAADTAAAVALVAVSWQDPCYLHTQDDWSNVNNPPSPPASAPAQLPPAGLNDSATRDAVRYC
jgi:hypothetical protein